MVLWYTLPPLLLPLVFLQLIYLWCTYNVQRHSIRDQLFIFLFFGGGGGAEVFCPNILFSAPVLENSPSGEGGGGVVTVCKRKEKFLYDHEPHIVRYSSVWKGKKGGEKSLSPENQVVLARILYLLLARKSSAFCSNITCFLPEYGHLKTPRGLPPPPPPPRTLMLNRGKNEILPTSQARPLKPTSQEHPNGSGRQNNLPRHFMGELFAMEHLYSQSNPKRFPPRTLQTPDLKIKKHHNQCQILPCVHYL